MKQIHDLSQSKNLSVLMIVQKVDVLKDLSVIFQYIVSFYRKRYTQTGLITSNKSSEPKIVNLKT